MFTKQLKNQLITRTEDNQLSPRKSKKYQK